VWEWFLNYYFSDFGFDGWREDDGGLMTAGRPAGDCRWASSPVSF
jgi:hypothetical protein